LDRLRSLRDTGTDGESTSSPEVAVLAATDPANPYGATLKWPAGADGGPAATSGRGPTRSVGATVILVDGALAAYLARGDRQLTTFLPDTEPDRSRTARAVARTLIERARSGEDQPRGMLIEEIDGAPAAQHPVAAHLARAGFVPGALGLQATLGARQTLGYRPRVVPAAGAGRSTSVSSPFARRYFDTGDGDDDA
jgi:ATP-dependent Lhr-like helicase